MTQLVCKDTKTYSRRYRVCFECQPSMDSGDYTENSRNHVLGDDDGDLMFHAIEDSSATEPDEDTLVLSDPEELEV